MLFLLFNIVNVNASTIINVSVCIGVCVGSKAAACVCVGISFKLNVYQDDQLYFSSGLQKHNNHAVSSNHCFTNCDSYISVHR